VFVPVEDPAQDVSPLPAPKPEPVHIILDELSDDELESLALQKPELANQIDEMLESRKYQERYSIDLYNGANKV